MTDIDNTQEKTIYRINFETDKKEYYNKVQSTCRECIDNKDPSQSRPRTEVVTHEH